jgi:hypothetical protein
MQFGIDKVIWHKRFEVESPMEVIVGIIIDCDFQILDLHSRVGSGVCLKVSFQLEGVTCCRLWMVL